MLTTLLSSFLSLFLVGGRFRGVYFARALLGLKDYPVLSDPLGAFNAAGNDD